MRGWCDPGVMRGRLVSLVLMLAAGTLPAAACGETPSGSRTDRPSATRDRALSPTAASSERTARGRDRQARPRGRDGPSAASGRWTRARCRPGRTALVGCCPRLRRCVSGSCRPSTGCRRRSQNGSCRRSTESDRGLFPDGSHLEAALPGGFGGSAIRHGQLPRIRPAGAHRGAGPQRPCRLRCRLRLPEALRRRFPDRDHAPGHRRRP